MNTLQLKDQRRVISLLFGMLVLMYTPSCASPNTVPDRPLPTTEDSAPLLPGCQQLRAINGEC